MTDLLRRVRQFLGAPRAEKRAALEWRIKRLRRTERFPLPGRLNRYRLRYLHQLVLARRAARDLYRDPEPLISVLIPTYNRAELLVKRSVPSVLRQTYSHFEIVVVGDACTDDTEARLRDLGDPRIRFHNLPVRGKYPEDPYLRWLVAGSAPGNQALVMARGKWIAWLDDDDEFSPDHLEVLLTSCLGSGSEFAYGVMMMEVDPGIWQPVGSYPPACGQICNAAVLYGAHLRFFRYDLEAWQLDEPNDWNLWKRMWGAGVRMGFVDRMIGKHFLEHRPRGTTSPGDAVSSAA
jgi:glycosyltransferase involved in cell wall biosynthesis